MNPVQKTVTSHDGTNIAYEVSGSGPAIILVAAALSDRSGTVKLARLLAPSFTVVNYDRRGRGKSSDTPPYAVEREVEDIAALIDAAGSKAYLFGSSSGAVLALEAASRLGSKVQGLVMYEPPFIVDESRPPMPNDFADQVLSRVAAGRRGDAVKHFFHRGMGIPAVFVTLMSWLMPGWSKMAAMAHTIPYDLAVLDGTQSGRPLPAQRWSAACPPGLVLVGSRSEAFFHVGAKALASLLPQVEYRSLPGSHHGSVEMSPKRIAEVIRQFVCDGSREAIFDAARS